MKYLIVLALVLFSQVESKSKPEGRIIGGQYDDANNYKHLVRIVADGSSCGGALISKNAVITAAHCAKNPNPNAYQINEGKTTQSEMKLNSERLIATAVYANQEFNKFTFLSDVAVILVDPNHSMNTFLTLDTSGMASVGLSVHLAGWGYPQPDGPVSQSLKSIDLRVVDNSVCRLFPQFNPASHICVDAEIDGHGACRGDSGSPLVAQERMFRTRNPLKDINDILKFLIHNFLNIRPSDTFVVHTCLNDTLVVHTRLNDTLVVHTRLNDTLVVHTRLNDTLVVHTRLNDTLVVHTRLNDTLVVHTRLNDTLVVHTRLNDTLVVHTRLNDTLVVHTRLNDTLVVHTRLNDTLVVHTRLNDTLVVHTRLNDTLVVHTRLNDTLVVHTRLNDILVVHTRLNDTFVVHTLPKRYPRRPYLPKRYPRRPYLP
ncbi:hypothetical protein L0F63_004306 [Massospora cicadina]|nr:hypothetical protein L0F63_004306 [Massospora cicadina]